MSGPAALLVVIGALYLLECIVAVPGGLVAFHGTARASWRLVPDGFRVGGRGLRFVFVPLAPWSRGMLLAADPADSARAADAAFDVEAVRARLAELRAATRALRVDALAMFATIFLLSPLVVRVLGWDTSWPFLVAAVLAIAVLIVADYRVAHAELFPGARGAPLGVLLTLALSPASAMRAADALARSIVRDRHVLAVAAAVEDRAAFEQLARAAVRGWRRGARADARIEALVRATLGDVSRLVAAPERRDESAQSYCPGCRAEFTLVAGQCERCDEALEPFLAVGG